MNDTTLVGWVPNPRRIFEIRGTLKGLAVVKKAIERFKTSEISTLLAQLGYCTLSFVF